MPANETDQAIHHHDLAVVTEVHLKAVEPSTARGKGMNLHTTRSQHLAIACRQSMAADPVEEDEHFHPFGRFAQQQLL
ncbi:hypothetical protein D3C78_1802290 [compost metagenome]